MPFVWLSIIPMPYFSLFKNIYIIMARLSVKFYSFFFLLAETSCVKQVVSTSFSFLILSPFSSLSTFLYLFCSLSCLFLSPLLFSSPLSLHLSPSASPMPLCPFHSVFPYHPLCFYFSLFLSFTVGYLYQNKRHHNIL